MTPSLLAAAALLAAPAGALRSAPAPQSSLTALDVAAGEVQALHLPDSLESALSVDVVLDGRVERLELEPRSLRGAGFEVLVQGADGAYEPAVVSPPATLHGTVAGREDAWVAGSLARGRLEVLVSLGDGRTFAVQPSPAASPLAGGFQHVAYEADDVVPPPGLCATPDGPSPRERFRPGGGSRALGGGAADFRVCEIACDADVEFYEENGRSVDATVADIEKILIGVEAIYGAEVEILYEIGTIIVRTAEPDPYSSTAPSTLLQQFDSHWSTQQQGVQRDIAHLFTGKNLDGSVIGIARLSAICSQSNGYGLSQSNYTGSLVLRIRLTAHELGHNWSAQHCNGEADCGIMCQGGCGAPDQFGASSTASVLNEKAGSGCLSPLTAPPVLAAVAGTAAVWEPEPFQLTGTDLFTATAVTVGGVPATFTVVDDLTIEVEPPLPAALGDAPVSVTTPLGTSNELAVTYVDTDPPQLAAPNSFPGGAPATWSYAGQADAAALVLFSLDDVTVPIEGLDVLLPEVVAPVGSLGPLGLGQLTAHVPALPIFTPIYSQLVTVQPAGPKTTEVQQSIVFL